jgi:hypothetical protein
VTGYLDRNNKIKCTPAFYGRISVCIKRNNQSNIYHELFDAKTGAFSVEAAGFDEVSGFDAGLSDEGWAFGAAGDSVGSAP